MHATDFRQATSNMTSDQQALVLAMSIVFERLTRLKEPDLNDLFELVRELAAAKSEDDRREITDTMLEILDARPLQVLPLAIDGEPADRAALRPYTAWIASKVAGARSAAKLTQAQLAERSGLQQSHISRIENGKLSPSCRTIQRIAESLGCPLADFDWNEPR
jgi:DNA-binding XRE family transcriptional regulator